MGKTESQIQGTNDYSTVSKCSMVQQGYFQDDYISHFIQQRSRRAPLINIGYYVRAAVIEAALQTFLHKLQKQSVQVISCGAGFDSSYFRLCGNKALHSDIIYYEVDFPEVVKRKKECIQDSQLLLDITGWIHNGDRDVRDRTSLYQLVASDLRDLDATEQALKQAGVNMTLPTMFLSECSITYMDEASSSELIKWAASKFVNATFVTYEQVYPNDGFGLVMQKHFESVGSPLLSVTSHPDLKAQEKRYVMRGWTSCNASSAYSVFMQVTDAAERQRVLSLEPFDEFEEWHLKCCHYTLVVASNGNLQNWAQCLMDTTSSVTNIPVHSPFLWAVDHCPELSRFSHNSVHIHGDRILIVGGFGNSSSNKGHKRLNEVLLIDGSSKTVCFTNKCNVQDVCLDAMHHTCTVLSTSVVDNTTRILLYGGRSSPRKPVNVHPVLLSIPAEGKGIFQCSVLAVTGNHSKEPKPRWRHSAAQIKIPGTDENQVLIFGGRTADLEVLGDLWSITVSADHSSVEYEEVIANGDHQPCPRFSHSCSTLSDGETMVITAGMGGQDFVPLADIWLFNASTTTWQEIVLNVPCMLPRYGHTSVVYREQLILVGGVNTRPGSPPGVCVVNLGLRTCMEYALPTQDVEHPILLHNHSSEQISEDGSKLVIVGGGGNCFSFGTAFNSSLIKVDLNQFMQSNS